MKTLPTFIDMLIVRSRALQQFHVGCVDGFAFGNRFEVVNEGNEFWI